MNVDEWKIKQEQRQASRYAHFDSRVSLQTCWSYISDTENIVKHSFYPFIHYELKSRKVKSGRKEKDKTRSIYYAAHLDGWIYKYYAYLLNEYYNLRVLKDGISSVAVAYRTDLRKSNIHFAKEAFNFIKSFKSCYVLIGDFTDFFESLDHKYLKKQLCDLLFVEQLPPDYYSVFKNVTKFSSWELTNLMALNSIEDSPKGCSQFNKLYRVLSINKFRKNEAQIKKNPHPGRGVPQGSPISATFANIYMLAIDKEINEFACSYNGFYMRYSDDFMIVLPDKGKTKFEESYNLIIDKIRSVPNLTLQDKKTRVFHVQRGIIENCTNCFLPTCDSGKNIIDFLGFSYNGESITIRDKTISKYYHRMYRKIKTIKKSKGYTPTGKPISCKKLYSKYSYKGTLSYLKKQNEIKQTTQNKIEHKGNFLDYVERAQTEFFGEPINRGTKNHMHKIRERLKAK